MMMKFLLLPVIFLTACSTTKKTFSSDFEEGHNSSAIFSSVEGEIDSYSPGGIASNITTGASMLSNKRQKELLEMIPDDQVAWTDPDDPLANNKDIDDAFSRKKKASSGWKQSYNEALKEARRSGKSILIWFHDNEISPPSKLLGEELLTTNEFNSWSDKNIIRVMYDKHAQYAPEIKKREDGSFVGNDVIKTQKRTYVNKAFDHFNVRGAPTIVILAPDGEQIDFWSGYQSGSKQLVFDKIKNSANLGIDHFNERKKQLSQRGFRTWSGSNGSKVFGLLTRYNEKTSDVWIKELDGHQTKTKLSNLTAKDQQWILQQKETKTKENPL